MDVFNFVQLALVSQTLHLDNKDTSPEFLTTAEQVKRAIVIGVASGGLITLKTSIHNIPKPEGQC